MLLTPIDCGLTYTGKVRIEAINLILRLIFRKVRIVYSHNILQFGIDCESHNRVGESVKN
jgi:hypothetical protein